MATIQRFSCSEMDACEVYCESCAMRLPVMDDRRVGPLAKKAVGKEFCEAQQNLVPPCKEFG